MKGVSKNISKFKIMIALGIIVILIISTWLIFFYSPKCKNWNCFNEHLKKCERANFIGGTKMIFEYSIEGNSGVGCKVNVKLLQGDMNNKDFKKLENQEMMCTLPKGLVIMPESDIGNCHGLLKEGLQDLIIEKLHTYLVQNLGKLNLEMSNITKSV